ncbi:alpha/beta fold hydrolase [Thalassotalea mangrovi]|uniref:Alpha/beta hydrolase n=1 Tax=Thalassotalea mangrovi TaxID=2572245 RepID=A0A4V5NU64_9GAMM|nr:alpha/beta hydrolase [Thalassotalea mangrovi]TKB44892.1 alpha/beta hydrolase [Thalassotalea mangrovi]
MKNILWITLVTGLLSLLSLPYLLNEEHEELLSGNLTTVGEIAETESGFIHYNLYGQETDPLVVLVHGFSVPSYTWDNTVPFLTSQGYRVLTFDLYGRGYSSRVHQRYDRALFVNQLNDLLMALNINEKVNLVGLSMGAAIISAFASDYPHKVDKLVLLAPFHQPVDIGILAYPLLGDFVAYSFMIPNMSDNQYDDFIEPENYPLWSEKYKIQMKYQGFRAALLTTARDYLQSDPMADFRAVNQFNIKSLLLWGSEDRVFSVTNQPLVATALGKHNKSITINNAGHALHYERAEQVSPLIVKFLSTSGASETP